jgi:hypothetical protein
MLCSNAACLNRCCFSALPGPRRRLEHVGAALAAAQKAASKDVSASAISLLESPPADLWPRLNKVKGREKGGEGKGGDSCALGLSRSFAHVELNACLPACEPACLLQVVAKAAAKACAQLDAAVDGYGLAVEELEEAHAKVAAAARQQLLVHAREAANTALSRVKDRFNEIFQRDEQGMPRTWQPSVDVTAVTATGRKAAAQLLAQLSFVRSASSSGGGGTGASSAGAAAEAAVVRLAEEAAGPGPGSKRSGSSGADASTFDLLSAVEWPGVAEEDVLLAPGQCRSIWRQFMSDSTFSVQQVGG